MAKEIERKFLVSNDRWRQQADAGTRLKQAYIVAMDSRSVRVRISGGRRAQLTTKISKTALVREEFEYDIPLRDAEDMMRQAIGIVIEKTRYRVPLAGFTWEVDVYHGNLSGLVVAEVEMTREDDKPTIPDWIGREVTGNYRYSNHYLAMEGLPQLTA
ncbi:CYTH domain-containing protein [Pararhizobium capsulatum DSM 1112]|uniref:CYTH domain-containing protein n=1 Tax=Pararhizobium capsulatum DSM 1112 TaxID=1121113 RepID=A0ABU0BW18_9HYPH|nr:CYTH domain-containing protein [Pararhizobium capsulatum]MDQ0321894.1 CYTH domain-containing protein [Pararhizobium capsulatum DSM 1112]